MTAPKVFISYSHDSEDHKQWTLNLANRLSKSGVDVVIDQKDLRYGEDIAKFMEKAINDSDRVLMICTKKYANKADEGTGGVGYEVMIVTGEMFQQLGTTKFIPIIRQDSETPVLPKFLSTRRYANLSKESNFDEEFKELLDELLQARITDTDRIAKEGSFSENDESKIETDNQLKEPINLYEQALTITKNDDVLAWRRLKSSVRRESINRLAEWRSIHESSAPTTEDGLIQQSLEGISTYIPMMVVALAGVASRNPTFNDQFSTFDEMLFPEDWNLGGYTVIVDLPYAAAFIFQALHGAMCIQTAQLPLAIKLIRTSINFPDINQTIPAWKHYGIMGHSDSLTRKSTVSWKILSSLSELWTWLEELFGTNDEYKSLVGAYYMALTIFEFSDLLAQNGEGALNERDLKIEIPLSFLSLKSEIKRYSYNSLLDISDQVKDLWRSMGVSDEKVVKYWEGWIKISLSWFFEVYRFSNRSQITHAKLMEQLFPDSFNKSL
jgi:hypothetical protein